MRPSWIWLKNSEQLEILGREDRWNVPIPGYLAAAHQTDTFTHCPGRISDGPAEKKCVGTIVATTR